MTSAQATTGIHALPTSKNRGWLASAIVGWVVTVAVGFSILWNYASRGVAPQHHSVSVQRLISAGAVMGEMSVIMAIHPLCPCTRDSIEQLDRLAAKLPGLRITVLVTVPESDSDEWFDSGTVRSAKAIPGAHVLPDREGVLAAVLGMSRSGHTLLIDSECHVRFNGGLTSSRLHTFASPGVDAALEMARGAIPRVCESDVYGCVLVGAHDDKEENVGRGDVQ